MKTGIKKISILMMLIIAISSCSNKLSNNKAEELIIQHLNYSAETPRIYTDMYVLIQTNANAVGEISEWSTSFASSNPDLKAFLTKFAIWLIDNGYYEKGELEEGTFHASMRVEVSLKSVGITKKGESFFNNTQYSKTTMTMGDIPVKREVYLLQYSKPKVIGVRDLGNDKYEVIYQQGYEPIDVDYANSLKNDIPIPQPKEITITIAKVDDEFRIE